nr:hypothetical protein [Tanacetum cinerariifolium]GEZ70332.1 hypothetical protein [Tanacetum cinerariifolium]
MKKTNRKQSDNKCKKMVIFKHLEENSGVFEETTDEYGYEGKTCKKRFKLFQALGGYQGIHKRINKPNEDDMMLGGHMRKQRLKKLDLWRQNEVLTMEELERRRVEVDERMRVKRDLILAAKELRLWF